MSSLDQARATQVRNIEARTGKSLDQLRALIKGSGLAKHGELRSWAMQQFGLGYGDANTLVHLALASDGQSAAEAGSLRRALAVARERDVHERVRVAVAEPEVLHRPAAQLAVLRVAAAREQPPQLLERLAGPRLDVPQLCVTGLVE